MRTALFWVQLFRRRGVKGEKQREDEFHGGGVGWVGRATGGRYRKRQEAGHTETDRREKRAEREHSGEKKRGRQARWRQYHICGCMLSTSQISILSSTVFTKTLEWWTGKINLNHSGLSPVDTTLPLWIAICKSSQREGRRSRRRKDRRRMVFWRGKTDTRHGRLLPPTFAFWQRGYVNASHEGTHRVELRINTLHADMQVEPASHGFTSGDDFQRKDD